MLGFRRQQDEVGRNTAIPLDRIRQDSCGTLFEPLLAPQAIDLTWIARRVGWSFRSQESNQRPELLVRHYLPCQEQKPRLLVSVEVIGRVKHFTAKLIDKFGRQSVTVVHFGVIPNVVERFGALTARATLKSTKELQIGLRSVFVMG